MASPNTRPRTPGKSPSPEHTALPSTTENGNNQPPRRTSLGFLRRAKSTEPLGDRKASGGSRGKKLAKEQAREEEARRQREAAAVPKQAPRLPDFAPPPQLRTFGGDENRPDSVAIISNRAGRSAPRGSTETSPSMSRNVPMPPMPGSSGQKSEYVDPYARTESMTHRGRYSYASSAVSTINSPRRVRRRKDPTPYK